MTDYNPQKIEKKWQKEWERIEAYKSPDRVKGKKNFYHLVMFPYPSGDLHIGHWYNFAPADIYARFKRLQGFNVMSPIGFDAFGLPAENAAIKRQIHPKIWTYKNIKKMREQLRSMGPSYDWSREIITSESDYYKWTQWMFLQFYKKGLAYKKKALANWCPACKSILANEQAEGGVCWRCESPIERREVEQWFFKITDYAEKLLKDLENLDWPEKTKIMQKNWIGKSEGAEIKFPISDFQFPINVFTTRADTLFGCTYIVIAPEHSIIKNLKSKIKNWVETEKYIKQAINKTDIERLAEDKEKTGIELKGIKAINPVNNQKVPIFVADYVLMGYGTGAIMAVPAHDQRDFEFAQKQKISIIKVIKPEKGDSQILKQAYGKDGVLINSGQFSGLKSAEARTKITKWLEKQKKGKKDICYKLRDWLVSRQRYWGVPIPMVFCQECGWQPVKEKDLPVLLPKIKDYLPTKEGRSPLAKVKSFVKIECPKCQKKAERETDTMDTFVCSSWYFLRYTDSKNKKEPFNKIRVKNWLPVDIYIGGAEHTVLHLLYSRFFTKVLRDLRYLDFKEPFLKLRHQGIILGPDGQKMSKSKGNVIDPDQLVKEYGTDAVRAYLCFMGPYDQGGVWQPKGIVGVYRFLNRVWDLSAKLKSKIQNDKNLKRLIHKTIKKVTEDIENFRFNTAISALMILANAMEKQKDVSASGLKILVLLLAPFAPYVAEELWQKTRGEDSVHNQKWPKYDPKLIKEEIITLIIQINGKVRDKIEVESDISEEKAKEFAFSQEKVLKWLKGKKIKKIIFVSGKLINIVMK